MKKSISLLFLVLIISGCATIPMNKLEPTVISCDVNAPSEKVFSVAKEVISNHRKYKIIKEDRAQGMIMIDHNMGSLRQGALGLGRLLTGIYYTSEYAFNIVPVDTKSKLSVSMLVLMHTACMVEAMTLKPSDYKDITDMMNEIKTKTEAQ